MIDIFESKLKGIFTNNAKTIQYLEDDGYLMYICNTRYIVTKQFKIAGQSSQPRKFSVGDYFYRQYR